MFGIGTTELLVILVVGLMVLGPKKLPEIARTLGKAMGEFRRVSTDFQRTINAEVALDEQKENQKKAAARKAAEKKEAETKVQKADAKADATEAKTAEAAEPASVEVAEPEVIDETLLDDDVATGPTARKDGASA